MRGQTTFTSANLLAIGELIDRRIGLDRDGQKQVRRHLRTQYHFFISDFGPGLTSADLTDLVLRGIITRKDS